MIQPFRRVLWKTFVAPWKYRGTNGYDAQAYWGDRLGAAGGSLTGPGHEGRSEDHNVRRYEHDRTHLLEYLADHEIAITGRDVLEIGCGNGYYTGMIAGLEPACFTGLDVTDVMFAQLRERHPTFRFVQADVTGTLHDLGQFDVVLMISVLQHIVSRDGLDTAMANVSRLVRPGGVFIVNGFRIGVPVRGVFNVRWWPESKVLERLPGFRRLPAAPLPNPSVALIKDS